MKLEEYKKEVDKNMANLFNKANEDEKELLNNMINTINDLCEEKQELIDYLKEQIDLQTEITKNSKSFRSTKYQIAISLRLLCQEILSKIEKE